MGLDLMTEPDLIKDAKAEFDNRTAGRPYTSINVAKTPSEARIERHRVDHGDMLKMVYCFATIM
jgi:hypothetical protein